MVYMPSQNYSWLCWDAPGIFYFFPFMKLEIGEKLLYHMISLSNVIHGISCHTELVSTLMATSRRPRFNWSQWFI